MPGDGFVTSGQWKTVSSAVFTDRDPHIAGQRGGVSIAVSLIVTLILLALTRSARPGCSLPLPVMITIPGAGALVGTGHASAGIRYAAGRASRSVSSWMSTAIFVRADECCRL